MRLPDDAGAIAGARWHRAILAVARPLAVAAAARRGPRRRDSGRHRAGARDGAARFPRRRDRISSRLLVTLASALLRLNVAVAALRVLLCSRYRLDPLRWLSTLRYLLEVYPICWPGGGRPRRQRRRTRRLRWDSSTSVRHDPTGELGEGVRRVLARALQLEAVLARQRDLHSVGALLVVGGLQNELVEESRIYRRGRARSLDRYRP